MAEKRISQSLNKAYKQLKIEKAEFERFKRCLNNLYSQISSGGTEEQLKGDLMDFLKGAFYSPNNWLPTFEEHTTHSVYRFPLYSF